MSQKQKTSRGPLVEAILLGLILGLSLGVWKWLLKPDPAHPVVKHQANTSPGKALKYWTAERMHTARPARMPHVEIPDAGNQSPESPPDKSDSQQS